MYRHLYDDATVFHIRSMHTCVYYRPITSASLQNHSNLSAFAVKSGCTQPNVSTVYINSGASDEQMYVKAGLFTIAADVIS